VTPERQLKVDVARRAWISHLVDMTRRNNLLFYRETKTGTRQVGCSRYRIYMLALHPHQEGRFALAIECHGASYHSAPTARDRDRVRQQQLEALGWRFHRIWSTDWFTRREEEVQRTLRAFEAAVAEAEEPDPVDVLTDAAAPAPAVTSPAPATTPQTTRSARPPVPAGRGSIADYTQAELRALVRWVRSDGLLHTNQEIVAEVTRELGFARKGAKIVAAIEAAVKAEGH
jgi:hypothetical protein